MKRFFTILTILSFYLALTGAGCGNVAQNPDTSRETPAAEKPVSDKELYASNLDEKIRDLQAHIDQVQQHRESLSTNSLEIFDQQMAELRLNLSDLATKLQALKEGAEDDFMPLRDIVNKQLQKTEDLYLKIITDYKIELDA